MIDFFFFSQKLLQKWEESRWTKIVEIANKFCTSQERIPKLMIQMSKECVSTVEAANMDADLKEFLNTAKHLNSRPDRLSIDLPPSPTPFQTRDSPTASPTPDQQPVLKDFNQNIIQQILYEKEKEESKQEVVRVPSNESNNSTQIIERSLNAALAFFD